MSEADNILIKTLTLEVEYRHAYPLNCQGNCLVYNKRRKSVFPKRRRSYSKTIEKSNLL